MPNCPIRDRCQFFQNQMSGMPATTILMKKSYCEGDNSTCARWLVLSQLGPTRVPQDLFPNQRHRVATILAGDDEQSE